MIARSGGHVTVGRVQLHPTPNVCSFRSAVVLWYTGVRVKLEGEHAD